MYELAPKNKKLLAIREEMQKKIDEWHIDNKGKEFDSKAYENFLKEIGYLVKEGKIFNRNKKCRS